MYSMINGSHHMKVQLKVPMIWRIPMPDQFARSSLVLITFIDAIVHVLLTRLATLLARIHFLNLDCPYHPKIYQQKATSQSIG